MTSASAPAISLMAVPAMSVRPLNVVVSHFRALPARDVDSTPLEF
jgi:hypothetical protein